MDKEKQPGIRFHGIQLMDLHFSIKGEVPSDRQSIGPAFSLAARFSEDEKRLELSLTTDLFGALDAAQRPPIEFQFTFVALFETEASGNLSLKDFAKHNAPALMIPYVRELVTNISSRTSLPTRHAPRPRKIITACTCSCRSSVECPSGCISK